MGAHHSILKSVSAARAALRAASRLMHVMLAVSLLASSTPAAPRVLADTACEWGAGALVWWRTGPTGASLGSLLNTLSAARPKQEGQKERNARVRRVKIYPSDVTIGMYERVVFVATALNADDQPVGGVAVAWSASDERREHATNISQRGEFEATAPGTYKVTADVGGKKEHVTVTVLGGERRREGERPAHVYSVSSRDRAPESSGASAPARKERQRRSTRGVIRIVKSSFVEPAPLEPAATPVYQNQCDDDYRWNRCNYMWGDDPDNRRGQRPGVPQDQGAGNGNFQVSAPILSLAGRGLDVSLGLVYNSRVWSKNGTKINYDMDQDWPAAGWSLGFGRVVGLGIDKGAMIIDADGTRHGFTGQINNYNWGSYSTLHTTDGTFIDYIATTNTAGTINYAQVKYPDGTVIEFGAPGVGAVYPTSILNSDGNFINVSYVGNVGPRIQTITDTLHRVVSFYYDANNLLTAIEGPGLDGSTRPLIRLHYTQLPTLNTSFVGLTPFVRSYTPWALDAIYYPETSTGYWFGDADSYSSYGMIQKVVEQRGMGFSASSLNEQGTVSQGVMTQQQDYAFQTTGLTDAPTFLSMTDSYDGMDTPAAVTSYLAYPNNSPRTSTITLPNGTQSIQYSYNHPGAFDDGLVYRDEMKDSAGNLLRSSDVMWGLGDYDSARPVSVTTTDRRDHKTGQEFSYGASRNQVAESRVYDYGYTYQGTSNVLLQKTVTQYNTAAGYANNHIFSLPSVVEIYDGANTRMSRTEYEYDGATPPAAPNGAASLADLPTVVTQHDDAYNPFAPQYEVHECNQWDNDQINCLQWNDYWKSNYRAETDYRGNVTRATSYSNASSEPAAGAVTETRSYDIAGNIVTSSSSCCELTSYVYTDDTQYAYLTSQTRGSSNPNSPLHITTGATYDFSTGLPLSSVDADGRTSQMNYESSTLRPHEAILPTGARATYAYDDTLMKVTQTTTLSSGGAVATKSIKYLNGAGQLKREEALAAPEAATWDSSVLDVVDTKYDALGRVWKQSRPYRKGSEEPQLTTNTYDALGRLSRVESSDGSFNAVYFDDLDNDHPRPSVASSAPGETMLTVDSWGRERWARTDAQGRLVELVEPDPDGNGSVATSGLVTTYGYDALGSLTDVVQGAQHRRFSYDSLRRLVRQKLAETDAVFNDAGTYVGVNGSGAAWGDLFNYDTRSNLVSHTDARNVKATFSYQDSQGYDDPLNRLQSVSYLVQTGTIAATDTVSYSYDTAGDLSRVVSITTKDPATQQVRTTEAYRYDTQARPDQATVTLASRPGFSLVTNYAYDNLGRVTDITYPAQLPSITRKTMHQDYDVASRLSNITVDGAVYASGFDYDAASNAKSLKVGAAGANQVTEKYVYDPATGLLSEQKAYRGTNENSNRLLHLSYDYLRPGTTSGRTGQLTKVTDNLNAEKGRIYSYDMLGRLKHVGGGDPATASIWTQDYTYDRYGNRTHVTASGNTLGMKSPANPSVKKPDVELAANILPKSPEFMRAGRETSTTDAPESPLLSGAAAKSLATAFAPGAPSNVTVTSASATQVGVSWTPPAGGADHYDVERAQGLAGSYTYVGTAAGNATSFSDTTVTGGVAYLYRVRSVDAGGGRSGPSNVALGGAFTFADDPIVTQDDHDHGVNANQPLTTIQALHITQLRSAVNAVRALVPGLGQATWTHPTLTPNQTVVTADDVRDLRTALADALTDLGIPLPGYTDATLYNGQGGVRTTIKRAHIKELRLAATRGQSASTGGGSGAPVPRDGFDGLTYDAASNRINTGGWEYDAAGNQTKAQVATNVWQRYEYDAAGRLVAVKTEAGTLIASYIYCYSRARLVAQEGQTRTYYSWSGGGVAAEYTEVDGTPSASSPQWSKSYVYLGNRLLATQQPATGGERVEYYHADRLGTRVVSNNADATYYEQTTLPYGTALDGESTGASSRRFTTYDRSTATGLDYAVNRSYDPRQGRFTQVDPMGMAASSIGDPQTLNLYAYCGNDPVNQTDPNGLFFGKLFKWIGKILKIITIVVAVALAVLAVFLGFVGFSAMIIFKLALMSGLLFATTLGPRWLKIAVGVATAAVGIIQMKPGIIWNLSERPGHKWLPWLMYLGSVNAFLQQGHSDLMIDKQNQKQPAPAKSDPGKPLTPCVKKILSKYFDSGLLDNIRLHYNASTPPLMHGYTVGNDIYFDGPENQSAAGAIALIGHEVKHAEQYSKNQLSLSKYGIATASTLSNPFALGAAVLSGHPIMYLHDANEFEGPAVKLGQQIKKDLDSQYPGKDPCP